MNGSVGAQLGRVCPRCGREDSVPLVHPTTDEQDLAELLGIGWPDVVRALGSGWRRDGAEDGRRWFVCGEPAQITVGVDGPSVVLARPQTGWDAGRQVADRFDRDDLRSAPWLVAAAAEAIASRRRRSFRWCRTCRRVHAPETFLSGEGVCRQCADAYAEWEG